MLTTKDTKVFNNELNSELRVLRVFLVGLSYIFRLYSVKPKNFTALSTMIFLRTSGFILTC